MIDQKTSLTTRLRARLKAMGPPVLIAVVLLILSALAASARTWITHRAEAGLTSLSRIPLSPPNAHTTVHKATRQRLQAELIRLRPTGFEPAEIRRPKGRFLLAVDNRSEVQEPIFQLSRETGNKLHEMQLPKGGWRWRQVVELHPGSYVLREAGHPEWECRITVTAQ